VVVGGPLVGATMNPAGVFGYMLWYNQWQYWWLYIGVPMLTAAVVAVVYKFLFIKSLG
jgi:glycerol uptake facilitator-like aquaporin